jgi:hypothetical protein
MNCQTISDYPQPANEKTRLIYAGNLYPNRWKVLVSLGKALQELASEGVCAELHVYSLDINEKIKKAIDSPPYSMHMGSVDSIELIAIRKKSDIMVHVEGFDRKCRRIMLYSMSTKIPEYLSSNRCMLAIVPKDFAEAKYLIENDAAAVVTEPSELKGRVKEIISDLDLRKSYAAKGVALAIKKHDPEKQRALVYNELSNACHCAKTLT